MLLLLSKVSFNMRLGTYVRTKGVDKNKKNIDHLEKK